METVVLKNLGIGYGLRGRRGTATLANGRTARVVAGGLNAALNSGELTCLIGCNGVGKSTLLRTLTAGLVPVEGDVLMYDATTARLVPLGSYTDRQLSRMIGIVLTECPNVGNMTADEMVAMGRSPYTGFWGSLTADDRGIVADAIGMVGIGELSGRIVSRLSDGERQKVMIAKALAQQTPVICLDEPTAFLDYPSKVEMMQLLWRLAHDGQRTVLLSTHDVELALQMADRLWLMERGGLSVGTPRQLADSGALGCFVERGGIKFDRDSLTLRVNKQQR